MDRRRQTLQTERHISLSASLRSVCYEACPCCASSVISIHKTHSNQYSLIKPADGAFFSAIIHLHTYKLI